MGELGTRLALAVGIGAVGAGVIVVTGGGDRVVAVILAFVGASALAGWNKARRKA